jgi:hypothetical protein
MSEPKPAAVIETFDVLEERAVSIPSEPRWLVTCSCGWTREASSEWAAKSISKLHPRLAPVDVAHVTRIEGPGEPGKGQQLTLT